jgi:hypothetical protein
MLERSWLLSEARTEGVRGEWEGNEELDVMVCIPGIIPGLHETILIDENPKFRGCQGVK